MGLLPTHGDESRCHPDPERSEGEGSAVPVRAEPMQILRFAQNDSLWRGNAIEKAVVHYAGQKSAYG
jgi:hypothetical protein